MSCKLIRAPILDSRTIVGIGIEDEYGIPATDMFELPIYNSFLVHQPNGERGSGKSEDSFGKRNVAIHYNSTFLAYTLLSAPVVGSTPPWAMLLEGCGMERIDGDGINSATYAPTEPGRSLTLHSHYGELRHPLAGGRGTISLTATPGKEMGINIEIGGLYLKRDAVPQDIEYLPTVTPILFLDAGMQIEIQGDPSPFIPVIKQWTLDLGNRIFRRNSGDEDNLTNACIVEPVREPRWNLVIEEDPRYDWNDFDLSGLKFRLSSDRTLSDGSRLFFRTNFECGLDSVPSYGNVDGVKVRNLDFNLTGDRYLEIGYVVNGG